MRLGKLLNFNFKNITTTNPDWVLGLITSLCRVDYQISRWENPLTTTKGKLGPIFYPKEEVFSPAGNSIYTYDYQYMFHSANKEARDLFIEYYDKLSDDISSYVVPSEWTILGTTTNMPLIDWLVYPLYKNKIADWLRLYEDLMEPYRPFSNYYLDEEMVRNEKTGSSHTANETEGTSENWSTGTSQDNENSSSQESDSGTVTQKVKGFNSTDFVDSGQTDSSSSGNRTSHSGSTSLDSNHEKGENTASGDRWNDFTEDKSYLLRYTGALDVDFQEWLKKEIEMRRENFIQEVIYADLDRYFCKGVY